MTSTTEQLWVKSEAFRRRYQAILPSGLRATVEAAPIGTTTGPGRLVFDDNGPFRVRVSYLLRVHANALLGEELPTLLRGQWVCSFRWDAGSPPNDLEVVWEVSESLVRLTREHRVWQRRRNRLIRAWESDDIYAVEPSRGLGGLTP